MLFNIRAKSSNYNGASITYTWRNVEAENEIEAEKLAKKWAKETNEQYKSPAPEFQTKSIEVWFLSNEELEKEDQERYREKAEFEFRCGGYD